MAPVGDCHLCGINGPLTFEHIPPRSAFNDQSLRVLRGQAVLNVDLDTVLGELVQRGSGDYTLCTRCNNNTGSWYGSAFVAWAYQAMYILHATRGQASLNYVYHIFPLRVLKQVICMFFSTNGSAFRETYPDLEKFVLDRNASGMRPAIQIYAYLNATGRTRLTGIAATGRIDTGTVRVISEIAATPLGFLMALGDSPAPDNRLIDITFMAKYHYDDRKHVALKLSVLPIYTYFPGDYRDRDTVRRAAAENLASEAARRRVLGDAPRD
jgi:hypothetical protein